MIIKLLIYFALGYLAYKLFKFIMRPRISTAHRAKAQGTGQIDDIMIKDPYCETHFAKKDGVHLNLRGEDFYFCSSECRDKYLAQHSNANTQQE